MNRIAFADKTGIFAWSDVQNCRDMPDDEQEILVATAWGVDKDVCCADTDDWGNHSFGLEGRGDWDGVIAWAEMPKYYSEGN